jgi:hypothetical protein
MKQELFAYLVGSDGHISEVPTDELLAPLEQLRQVGMTHGQNTSSEEATVYTFLQVLKQAIRTSRAESDETVLKQATSRHIEQLKN